MPEPRWDPTEEQFQLAVAQLARYHGWLVAHFRAARNEGRGKRWRTPVQFDAAGFPDLVLVRGAEIIFAELKRNGGRLQANQAMWLGRLGAVARAVAELADRAGDGEGPRPAVEACVWRPRDWELIEARLARPREAEPPFQEVVAA